MSNKAQLKLSQADDVITALPVPARNVQQVGFVVVLETKSISYECSKPNALALR